MNEKQVLNFKIESISRNWFDKIDIDARNYNIGISLRILGEHIAILKILPNNSLGKIYGKYKIKNLPNKYRKIYDSVMTVAHLTEDIPKSTDFSGYVPLRGSFAGIGKSSYFPTFKLLKRRNPNIDLVDFDFYNTHMLNFSRHFHRCILDSYINSYSYQPEPAKIGSEYIDNYLKKLRRDTIFNGVVRKFIAQLDYSKYRFVENKNLENGNNNYRKINKINYKEVR